MKNYREKDNKASKPRQTDGQRRTVGDRPADGSRNTEGYRKAEGYRKTDTPRQAGGSRQTDASRRTDSARPTDNSRRTDSTRPTYNSRRTDNPRPADNSRRTDNPRPADNSRRTDNSRPAQNFRRTDSPRPADNSRRTDNSRPAENFRRTDNPRPTDNSRQSDVSRPEDGLRLEGRNAVMEALNHDKTIDKILVKKGEAEGTLRVIIAKAKEKGIPVQEVSRQKLDEMAQSSSHQGVVAMCPAHEYAEVSDILDRAKSRGEDPFIIILDGITDTHNLGAIIRSADAAGAHGVIISKHRAAGLTGIVSKTSAGALAHVLVAKVVNISRTIEELKEKGCWVAAADMQGQNLYSAPLDGPIAIVIGGEGGGSGRLVKEKCDFVVKIPMHGKVTSLNASVAAGVLMYEVVRRRYFVSHD